MTDRGRSRQVAHSAIARQASEERSRCWPTIVAPIPKKPARPPFIMRSASPSPPSSASMSPDYYDSPPSPPRSLEDQVHVAYALDDIHLAKILLLRLKGIEVTSDDDPRIAAVQDEDFDFCFVPHGGLMDEQDEKAIREMQQREIERLEEKRRLERLRQCERKWEEEKRRLQGDKLAVLKRKEKRKEEEQLERRRRDERSRRINSRTVLTFNSTVHHRQQQPEFVYDFPFTARTPPLVSSLRPAPPPPLHSFDVPFSDVLKSMNGPLFPDDQPKRSPSRRKQNRLLDALLVQIEYNDEERRKRKGKQRAQPIRQYSAPCLACLCPPPPPLSPMPSSPSIRRTSSWLSFRTSSTSSSTTDLTSPASSPMASSSWFNARPKVTLPPRHSCLPHSARLVTVSAHDDLPLPIDVPVPPKTVPISHQGRQRSTSTVRAAKEGAGNIVGRMSKFMELAKGFQNAYVTAALFANTDSCVDGVHGHSDIGPSTYCNGDKVLLPNRNPDASKPNLRPEGYRVSSIDVAIFLDPNPQHIGPDAPDNGGRGDNNDTNLSPTPRYIPLTPPLTERPRSILPNPLPYKLHFKPVPTPIRSPFRFHALSQELHTIFYSPSDESTHRLPGQKIAWRIRSVGNPAHLRLKALGNNLWVRGRQWEGVARDTAMGGGRERIVGIAYEGLGRSSLSQASTSSSLN